MRAADRLAACRPAERRRRRAPLPVDAIARIAALEIAVHGWDVRQATGHAEPLPEPLAAALLPSALQIALAGDDRFAPPLPVDVEAPAGVHVLALLGRRG